jgi:putative ABC transport system permease protein
MHFATFILKNISRRRTRSILTILGLAVAVGSMVALLGVTANAEKAAIGAFETRRIDLVVQQAGRSSGLNSEFREYFVEQAKKLPLVEGVSAAVVNLVDVTREGGYTDPIMILGWRPDNFGYEDHQLLAGRKLQDGDRRKTMLGSTTAENLKKGVGDTVIFGRPEKDSTENVYEVIGVFRSPVIYENGGAIVSIEDGRIITGMEVSGFSVRVKKASPDSTAEVEEVRSQIEALRDPEDPSVRLTARTPSEFADRLQQLNMVRALSWIVSTIAIIIGIIGMINTMAMSVLERTQEIGILRAIGWPRRRIMRMVLGESVVIALASALVGTLAAIAATYILALFPKVNGFIEGGIMPRVILQGFAFTLLIGILGGAYPAFRAARLLPTEAIRHD